MTSEVYFSSSAGSGLFVGCEFEILLFILYPFVCSTFKGSLYVKEYAVQEFACKKIFFGVINTGRNDQMYHTEQILYSDIKASSAYLNRQKEPKTWARSGKTIPASGLLMR